MFFLTIKRFYLFNLLTKQIITDNILLGDKMNVDYKNIGFRISQRRRELKIKQNQLAEITDLSNNHISNIENGYSTPSLETLAKICEALNVTPDYLLLGNIKTNNIPQNICDSLLLCNEKSLSLIAKVINAILEEQ